jgi:hypothetical protein
MWQLKQTLKKKMKIKFGKWPFASKSNIAYSEATEHIKVFLILKLSRQTISLARYGRGEGLWILSPISNKHP